MNYGMYSDKGNEAVAGIVSYAQKHNLSWRTVYQNLVDLAQFNPQLYGEAMDTEVREAVYYAIGASKRDENFYI